MKHQHLIVRAQGRNDVNPLQAEYLVREIIREIAMHIADVPGNPVVYDCAIPGNEGVTVAAVIEESHCVLHSWPGPAMTLYQFDLYSCADFNPLTVIRFLARTLDLYEIDGMLIDRTETLKLVGGHSVDTDARGRPVPKTRPCLNISGNG